MSEKKDVFTREQVLRLWQHQFGPWSDWKDFSNPNAPPPRGHPYTCGNRDDHPELAGDSGVLVPTVRGWVCPFCDYTQTHAGAVLGFHTVKG